MSTARYLIGDVFERLAELPDDSVDLVLTSPPFLALRSYLPADHPDKDKEIGSEPTPAEFLDTLLALTAEWERVLAPHGSIAVELGDTYAAAGNGDGRIRPVKASPDAQSHRDMGEGVVVITGDTGWPLDKSLCGIPHLYHLSLAYGRNLLTGEPSQAGMWRVRNVVAWCRPNPPVGALGDKFRPGTSYITIACKSRDRWFDLDAVRTDLVRDGFTTRDPRMRTDVPTGERLNPERVPVGNPAGAPPLDWWQVPTESYSGSHYATWPRKLLTRPIDSMCPRQVCRTCGEPRRRMVEKEHSGQRVHAVAPQGRADRNDWNATRATTTTTGWSDCGHDDYRPGVVLDPFAGSGTTLAVATGMGRDAIGIDLDARNADLAVERCGMFLTVEDAP